MKKFWNYVKLYKVRFSFLLALIVFSALLFGLRNIPDVSEFWTTTIGRWYQMVVGFITSIVPWSIFEFLIIAAIVYGVSWIVIFIIKTKRKGFKKSSIKIVNLFVVVFSVIAIYVGTAGMAYHRKPLVLNTRDTSVVDQSQYYEISVWTSHKINECAAQLEFDQIGSVKRPYSNKKLYEIISKEYDKIPGNYFTKFTAKPKQLLLFGWLYTELNISGVTFLPTGEANYNQNVPNIDIPFVIAHELAHTKGVMNETEANDIAMYICVNSDDPYLQYSGLCNAYTSLEPMAMTANDDTKLSEFFDILDDSVWKDFAYSNHFWEQHTFFKDMSKWFNDLYLKIFGNQTTDAYNDHIDDDIIIIDDDQTFVLNSLSPFQEVVVDYWLKENGH